MRTLLPPLKPISIKREKINIRIPTWVKNTLSPLLVQARLS